MNDWIVVAGIGLVPPVIACLIKNKIVKALLSLIGFFGCFIFSIFLTFLLPDFVGPNGVWLSFVLPGTTLAVLMILAWKPFPPKVRRTTVFAVVGATVLTAAVTAGPGLYRNSIPQAPGEEINLYDYRPFSGDGSLRSSGTQVKLLDSESSLKLDGDLPRLDGATALYPLYAAFARAVYPEEDYSPYANPRESSVGLKSAVVCSTTGGAFENLIDGYADMIFLMGVSEEQREAAQEKGLELTLTPIGREAFVFFVNSRNPIENLSVADVKQVYSGEALQWRDVGGSNDMIRAYQRPNDSGSQIMLRKILDGSPLVPAPQEDIYNTMLGMYRRVAAYRNYKNSLGYSFRFYIQDMVEQNQVKLLSIGETAPTPENIESNAYPFSEDFYAVTAKQGGLYLNPGRAEDIDQLRAWILSQQGQFLVEATGYVPLPPG